MEDGDENDCKNSKKRDQGGGQNIVLGARFGEVLRVNLGENLRVNLGENLGEVLGARFSVREAVK